MRVNGEWLLLMDGWMDFLCLTLAACLARRRLRPGRMALAAAIGAAYGVLAWTLGPWLRGIPALTAACLGMAMAAFGRDGLRLWPLTAAAGLFFFGTADFLLAWGASPAAAMLLCGGVVLGIAGMTRASAVRGRGEFRLRLTVQKRSAVLPAFRDSGNLLRDAVSGLPVIVASETLLRPLLPQGLRCGDLSGLPGGWRLIPVQTAAGQKCLMCFQPERAWLLRGKIARPIRAMVAIAENTGSRALLPEAIFMQEEGK